MQETLWRVSQGSATSPLRTSNRRGRTTHCGQFFAVEAAQQRSERRRHDEMETVAMVTCVLGARGCPANVRFGTGGGTRSFNAGDAEREAIGYAHDYGFGASRDTMARIAAIGIAGQ